MFSASTKTSTPSVSAPDPQFNYVTMLLHGDGSNGAQNNTFIDSSTNNYSITRYGNTTQGSFSPYGSNWSNYFLGTGNYLSLPSNAAFNLGTGAYTVEAWVYLESYAGSNEIVMFCNGNATGAIACSINTSGQIYLSKYGTGQVIIGSSGDVPLNQWNHIAYVRTSTSSNDTKLYVNGVVKATGTDSNNWNVTTTPTVGGLTIGGFGIIGYISNVRVVKGTAVYTGAFTPSTTPLTAISGTSLLTCQSNRFIDNSSNAFAITVAGSPSVQRFNPFGTSTAYSTSVIGGSGYFDGTDRLVLPAQSTLTGNFTLESYFYITGRGAGDPTIISNWPVAGSIGNIFVIQLQGASTTAFYLYIGDSAANLQFTASTSVYNQWNHIAVTRSGSSMACFFNGVRVATSTNSSTMTWPANSAIGSYSNGDGGGNYFQGYISNLRIVNGTAVYDPSLTTCTVPTAPLTAITNTQLLTNYVNGAIIDNAMMNDLETVGNAQISTSVVKYGTGSIKLNGTTDYLRPNAQLPFVFNTGDFTIEFWVYANSVSGWSTFFDNRPSTTSAGFFFGYNAGFQYYSATSNLISGGTLSISTWTHVALCRASGSVRIFVNGTQVGSTATDNSNYNTSSVLANGPFIGSNYVPNDYLNGYLDEFRVTKGYARYTANFTPPTAAFSNTGPI